jgi:hypothetical protein
MHELHFLTLFCWNFKYAKISLTLHWTVIFRRSDWWRTSFNVHLFEDLECHYIPFHVLSIKIIGYLCTGCSFHNVCKHGSCFGMFWQIQTLFAVMWLCTGTCWKGHSVCVCRKWYTATVVSRLCDWGKRGKRDTIAEVGKWSIQMTGTVIILELLCFLFQFFDYLHGSIDLKQVHRSLSFLRCWV